MDEKEYIIPYSEFVQAYMDCRRKKRNKRSALQYEHIWTWELPSLCEEVNNKTYEIGTSIAFVVSKPKYREVFAASFRDRIVHHLLCSKLEPLFEEYFIKDTYNCRIGKGTHFGIRRLNNYIEEVSRHYTRDCWVAKFDMQGFFMSIHKPTLWKMLKRFINERYNGKDKELVLWLTKKIALHSPEKNCIMIMGDKAWKHLPANKSLFHNGDEYGLPIGNLTSQMFANFYLTEFDIMMSGKFKSYGRYVDDFYIISHKKAKILKSIPKIRAYLEKLQITLHPNKFYLQHYSKGISFVGGICKPGRIHICNRTIHNCELAIEAFNNNEINANTVRDFMPKINSYLGFMRHNNSYAIRRKLILGLDSRIWDYVYVSGHFDYLTIKKEYTEEWSLRHDLLLK